MAIKFFMLCGMFEAKTFIVLSAVTSDLPSEAAK